MARAFITDITGRTGPQGVVGSPGLDAAVDVVAVPSATHEWWIGPSATQLQLPYPRIVKASYSTSGQMLVSESTPGAGTKTVVVDAPTWEVDDHNAPALYAEDGHRMIMMWTHHGNFNPAWMVVGDKAGTIESLGTAPVRELVTVAAEHASNYIQIFRIRHLSTVDGSGNPLLDYFWGFTRRGDRWQIIRFTINQNSGAYTFVDRVTVVTLGGLQAYTTVAETHSATQGFRLASYSNPDSGMNAIWYLELNPVTGVVSSPLDGSINYTLGTDDTGVAVYAGSAVAKTPLIAAVASTTSRRLLAIRPGPALPAILWAQWANATPDAATYKLTEWTGSAWATTDLGAAGPRFGYVATSNYLAGACFADPCINSDVYIARNQTLSTLERSYINRAGARASEVLATASAGRTIIRPIPVMGGSSAGVLYTELSGYSPTGFTFNGNVRSSRKNGSDSTAGDTLLCAGSLILLDPGSPTSPTFGAAGNLTSLPNLAAASLPPLLGWGATYNLSIANNVGQATGTVERTKKGGIHVIAKRSGTVASQAFAAVMPAELVSYLMANWANDIYVGVIATVTRKRVTGGTSIPPFVGLHADTATSVPGWAELYPAGATGNIASTPSTTERIGFQNATVVEGTPFLADMAVNRRNTAWASEALSAKFVEMGNTVPSSTDQAQSVILYVAYMEDLTVSGRSYDKVHAFMADMLASGRFAGDVYTTPSSLG